MTETGRSVRLGTRQRAVLRYLAGCSRAGTTNIRRHALQGEADVDLVMNRLVDLGLVRTIGAYGVRARTMGNHRTREGGGVSREMLVHLNVTVPDGDDRTADQISDALEGALEVGSDNDSVRDLDVVVALAEEI